MRRVIPNLLLGVTLLSIASCKAKPDEKQAIRAGVMNYLNTRKSLNIGAMDIDVTQTAINGNQAQAQVDFSFEKQRPRRARHAGELQSRKTWRRMGGGQERALRRKLATSRAR